MNRFKYEITLMEGGASRIAGVDEVGRGPLAGPVVAAAVVFPVESIRQGIDCKLAKLNDSKKLSSSAREHFYSLLTEDPSIQYAIAIVDAAVIDEINVLQATWRAMNQAVARLRPAPDHVLVDGLPNASLQLPQTAVVRGDSLSYSIAAASVLAKVTRDRLMMEYDEEYPGYGFAAHKGYGTREHFAALAKLGPCAIHRRSFSPVKQLNLELF